MREGRREGEGERDDATYSFSASLPDGELVCHSASEI